MNRCDSALASKSDLVSKPRGSRGFEVAERVGEEREWRYRVRRRSDGSILPVLFDEQDLREERRRGTWWV